MPTFSGEIDRFVADVQRPGALGKFFIVVYPPSNERRMQNHLPDLCTRLAEQNIRTAIVDVNAIVNDIITNRLEDLQAAWATRAEASKEYVRERSIEALQKATRDADSDVEVIFWKRVGGAYPFFRVASVTERLIGRLRASLVVLYPGVHEAKTHFALLGKSDGYQYRFEYMYEINEG